MTEISLNEQFEELVQATMQEQQDIDESTKRQDFCQDNNAIKKKNAGVMAPVTFPKRDKNCLNLNKNHLKSMPLTS